MLALTMMISRSKYRVPDAGFRYAAERFNLWPDGGKRGFSNAMLDRGSGGCDVVRLLAGGVVLSLGLLSGTPCAAADSWGGSLGVTSDYIVRGISRSYDRAALQLDLHYSNRSGFVAGLFASNTQIDPDQRRDVELDAFVGFAWTAGSGVTSESAEVSLQRPVLGRLSATAGIGYSHFGGPDAAGYAYWSVGAAYSFAPVSLAVSYVNTTAGAKALFYNAAADGRWTGTVIWRF